MITVQFNKTDLKRDLRIYQPINVINQSINQAIKQSIKQSTIDIKSQKDHLKRLSRSLSKRSLFKLPSCSFNQNNFLK